MQIDSYIESYSQKGYKNDKDKYKTKHKLSNIKNFALQKFILHNDTPQGKVMKINLKIKTNE